MIDGGSDGPYDSAPEIRPSGGVLQHHNNLARDGLYIEPALTHAAVMGTGAADGGGGGLQLDTSFVTPLAGAAVYAQPLYLEGSGSVPDLVIEADEGNEVYAFDAATGAQVWMRTLGLFATNLPSGPTGDLPCGGIFPIVGVTGTPVIDGATRTIYLDAMTIDTSSGSRVARHQVHALDAGTGQERIGWPVDLNTTASSGGTIFESTLQNQRGALTLLGGKVFIPFGGHEGDCAGYHGWVVGITTDGPPTVSAWATRAIGGGIWGASGIASDGASLYFATGNSKSSASANGRTSSGDNNGPWGDSETVYKFPTRLTPPASTETTDYFVPANWISLDDADADMGGTSPILVTVPGANPSNLIVALGKDHYGYLFERANLGGMDAAPIDKVAASANVIVSAAVAYTTPQGTYVVFSSAYTGLCPAGQTGALTALKISASTPPTLAIAWCGGAPQSLAPTVSQTDAQGSNTIVWSVANGRKLQGVDGDTGQIIFDGGSTVMAPVQSMQVPIIAKGRVFVASNGQVYAYKPASK
jgi:hypothetical protein